MGTAEYKAMRANARMPERTIPICMRGDLIAEFESLERELEQLPKTDSLDSGAGELLDRMDAIRAEMQENTYPVKLRAMPGPKYRAFTGEHPPRRDDAGDIIAEDRSLLLNTDTFWEPLIRASVIDPELPTNADWDEFLEGLTDFQYDRLGIAALNLNRGSVDIPKSPAASRTRRITGDE